jgi:hypothetical protein
MRARLNIHSASLYQGNTEKETSSKKRPKLNTVLFGVALSVAAVSTHAARFVIAKELVFSEPILLVKPMASGERISIAVDRDTGCQYFLTGLRNQSDQPALISRLGIDGKPYCDLSVVERYRTFSQ